MVTDRLLAVGGLFGEADCVARRAFRGVVDVIAGRKPARKTNRGEASLSGDSLVAMVFPQLVSVDTWYLSRACDFVTVCNQCMEVGVFVRAQELLQQQRERKKVRRTSLAAIGADFH